jgi:hypothetical protein
MGSIRPQNAITSSAGEKRVIHGLRRTTLTEKTFLKPVLSERILALGGIRAAVGVGKRLMRPGKRKARFAAGHRQALPN